eukprot:2467664-Prymnesium_polylepis.1
MASSRSCRRTAAAARTPCRSPTLFCPSTRASLCRARRCGGATPRQAHRAPPRETAAHARAGCSAKARCRTVSPRLVLPFCPPQVARPPSRFAASRPELDGDEAFTKGSLNAAINHYTLALAQKPTLLCYEKRCAAWAHVGK